MDEKGSSMYSLFEVEHIADRMNNSINQINSGQNKIRASSFERETPE